MHRLKTLGLAMMASLSLVMVLGAGTAAATELYKNTAPNPNDTLGINTELQMSLRAGTSLQLIDTWNSATIATCAGSELKGKTASAGGEAIHPSGSLSTVGFTNCSDPFTIISNGTFFVQHIAGTTNATLIVSGLKLKFKHTWMGKECTLETTGSFGVLTGATSATGHAMLHVSANLDDMKAPTCGLFGRLTGTYTVTTPTGLIFEPK
jgi:hypothetical protein